MQQETDAFATLHKEHRHRVFNYIHRRVSSREAAEELANDVFRIAWQKNPDAVDVTVAWLLTVARNVIGNEYRRRDRAGQLMLRIQESVTLASRGADPARQQSVADALLRLKDTDREVLLLAYWDDLAIAEISEVLGCSLSAAKVRLHRARKAFAKTIPAALMAEGDA